MTVPWTALHTAQYVCTYGYHPLLAPPEVLETLALTAQYICSAAKLSCTVFSACQCEHVCVNESNTTAHTCEPFEGDD